MNKTNIIEFAIQLKKQGYAIERIHCEICKLGFVTRYGNSPTKATLAYWISRHGDGLPDLRKARDRKPDSHYKAKKSEANKRYYEKNKQQIKEYQKSYYLDYIKPYNQKHGS